MYKLSEIKNLINSTNYGANDSELVKDGKGIRISEDNDLSQIEYDDFMSYKSFTLAGYSRQYKLNETGLDKPDSLEELKDLINKNYEVMAILPLYMFEHGNMLLGTSDFGDKWDSGQIGFVFVTKDMAREFDLKTEQEAINSINGGIEYFNKLNNETLYRIDLFEVKVCDCCNSVEELNCECLTSSFYDELEDNIIDALGADNVDLSN